MADTVPNGITPFIYAKFDDRVKLVEASFRTVLEADLHEDDKAGRILSAMAFLTTAAAVIFNIASSSPPTTELKQTLTQTLGTYVNPAQAQQIASSVAQNLQKPSLALFGLNVPVLAFYLYIFFVLVGAALYLGALGPSLNKPSWSKEKKDDKKASTLLFFHSIAPLEQEEWAVSWKNNNLKALQTQLVENYIHECWLIAQKVDAKVTLMSWGSFFFRIAILFFVVLMAALFSPDSGVVWLVFLFGLFGLFFSFAFVSGTLPRQEPQQPAQEEPQKSQEQPQQKPYWRTIISVVWDLIIPRNKSGKFRGSTFFLALLAGLSLVALLILLLVKFYPTAFLVALGVVIIFLIWFFVKFILHRKGSKAKARSGTA